MNLVIQIVLRPSLCWHSSRISKLVLKKKQQQQKEEETSKWPFILLFSLGIIDMKESDNQKNSSETRYDWRPVWADTEPQFTNITFSIQGFHVELAYSNCERIRREIYQTDPQTWNGLYQALVTVM